jgi:PAS domain S-box-containing protein
MIRANEDELAEIFPGDSEMAAIMRRSNWADTPLGDPRGWSDGLKIPLKMLLTSRFEMWLGWGPDLLFFYNDAYIPTLGLKHPSMLGKPFQQVWAEVYDDVADQVARVRAGEATWNRALLLLLERSGYPEETYHSFSYSPLYGEGDDVEGMLCVVSEETERVIGERRIEMLRMLGAELVSAGDENAICDAVCSVLSANRRDFPFALLYLDGVGHACAADAEHLLGREWPWNGSTAAALGDGLRVSLPRNLECPKGAWQSPPVEALAVPIAGAAGQQHFGTLVLGLNPHRPNDPYIADIAHLVAGQIGGAMANVGALESERRRADRIWTHARDLMVVTGSDGIIRSASPAWTRILGYPVEDVVGQNFIDFIYPEDVGLSQDAYQRALAEDDLTGFENRLLSRNGSFRWISWHTSEEDGLVYGYGRDVTEQKANAEALSTMEDALRQSQKMEAIGQLTGGIAHDFNNLLTGILGSLEMMQRKAAQGAFADVDRYMAAAATCAHRAASLTQRLLAFSRRQALDPKSIDANVLVSDMEELIRRSIGEAIEFKLVAEPNLWRTKCDPNQLESAILNLVVNARDAMLGGGRLIISTSNVASAGFYVARQRIAAPGDYVVISVTDTGHGMDADVAEKAFEPFFTTKPIGQGTGLGLSMIYGFARQSGGFAEIDSQEGKGTTVRLYLPRNDDVIRPVVMSAPVPSAPMLDKELTILVVEDEPMVRALVISALQDVGYQTIEAFDGAGGLEYLRSDTRIDLLVTDVGLPGGLNGRQLADAGRLVRPGLKVLFMTGYAFHAAAGNWQLEPGMEIINKPFAIDKLASRVQAIIGSQSRSPRDARDDNSSICIG